MLHLAICSRRWLVRASLWGVALLLALTLPLVVKAAIPSQNMTLLGAYGGSMNSITLDGDHAYIGQGAR